MLTTIEQELLNSKVPASDAEIAAPSGAGYYAIFVSNSSSLPDWVAHRSNDGLLYIGIATNSLSTRLCKQELRHKSPATFFRGLGAILGYRPPEGSLSNKKNQRNYKFSAADTAEIVRWINENLTISWVVSGNPDPQIEKQLINKHAPPLNMAHNPRPLAELASLRAVCREIACRVV